MNKILNFLKTSIGILAFAIVVVFFPMLFAFQASNEDLILRLCSTLAYSFAIAGLLLCTQGWVRKSIAILIALVSYIPNMIVQSYLLMDNFIMRSTDFWVVFNTNLNETANFFSTLNLSIFIYGAIYTILVVCTLIMVFQTPDNLRKIWVQLVAIVALSSLSIINPFRSKVPMIDFYKSYWHYWQEQRDVAEFYKNREHLVLNVECSYPKDKNNTIIIIIGESQNQQHMQLYGYPRQTNPMLNEIKAELTIYSDVCSPAIHTLECMKQILTFSNYDQPDMYKREANIIELLRSGGYKTFWYDNQGADGNGAFAIDSYTPTSYRTMAKQSHIYHAEGYRNDSVIISRLNTALQDTAKNKAIFLHLIGNHFDYANRYEPMFAHYDDTIGICSPCHEQLNSHDIQIINAYDNATRYNDYIIRTCIELAREHGGGGRCAMLYLSDHGEEIFDYQYYFSRSFEKISPAMCEPPLILWMNEEYRESCSLIIDASRSICTDDIIYGIMDMAGISYPMYDATRDLFSASYTSKERKVENLFLQDIRNRYQK